MKIILTENQYALLETIINEAATPMSTKIEDGGYIEVVYLVNDVEKKLEGLQLQFDARSEARAKRLEERAKGEEKPDPIPGKSRE